MIVKFIEEKQYNVSTQVLTNAVRGGNIDVDSLFLTISKPRGGTWGLSSTKYPIRFLRCFPS